MNAIAKPMGAALEQVLIGGDLSRLGPEDRVMYYKALCESVGLNPLTKPFEYITLNGKLTLYARRDATDQLRALHKVSITIVARETVEDCYVVTARATDGHGRQDESIGAVPIANLKGEARANSLMKAETKAKRRVTLSVCGLGMLDENEVDSIPGARPQGTITPTTGAMAALPVNTQGVLAETAQEVKALLANDQAADAYALWQSSKFEVDQEVAFWSLLDSKQRGVLTRMAAEERAHASGTISPQAKKRLEARITELKVDREKVKAFCSDNFDKEHFSDLTRQEYETLDAMLTNMALVQTEPAPPQSAPAETTPPRGADGADQNGEEVPHAGTSGQPDVTGAAHPNNAADPAKAKLAAAGSMGALAMAWKAITVEDRVRLEGYKEECKARILAADKQAAA